MGSTTTPNLGLFKATIGTAEPFRGGADVNANMDKLDAAIGAPYSDVTAVNVNNTASETQLMGTLIGGPANQGSIWKMEANGVFAHQAVGTTITFRIKIGGQTASWVVTTPASALSGRIWKVDATLYCLTTGVSGTWKISGLGVATVNATDTPALISATVTKDTTVQQTFEITAQWGTANAANTLSCDAGYIRRITNA
jgi:hypothetical protein